MALFRTLALPVLLGFIILGVYLFFHLGAWHGVEVELIEQPERSLLYEEHRGAYHRINEVISEVESWARQNQVNCEQTFGEYLDDPRSAAEERLHSLGGCVLNEENLTVPLPEKFKMKKWPKGLYVHAKFVGSPAIGPWRVYPKLHEFIRERHLRTAASTIEVYTIGENGMSTDYLIEVATP